ncbi:hypothetical protein GOHSU_23_00410 [Gordonia hirsuta DSM 44140 = NBRC 16056]|uniref:Uncharacterized protein n=1 Tax=Gordonia hirsuta DSM 44140 = NBRC 16056 TaxID=1121927 RepID=L7L969_9ACTN|nr:hypothetical protein [Gordonia hirsuta]GAC57695.1 hypothetical protein GOHSU_23_00410 [Gordonia hirsuta DSM 44140 = NBRC 16056]
MRPQNWSAPGLSVRSRVLVGLLASTWRPLSAQVPVGPAGVEAARLLFERVLAHASPPLPQNVYVPVEDRDAAGRVVRG